MTPRGAPALRFAGVSLRLGGRMVLDGLDFSVGEGAFVGLLGANGSGKTTLMRAALGLVRPASGRIEVLGQAAGIRSGQIGYMPQARAALAEMRLSGRAFVAAAWRPTAWGLPLLDRRARQDVERVLTLVDATSYAHRRVGSLSGGERQRLLLAQSLLGAPRMLLLDEPLASLDPHHQAATVDLVAGLQKRLGLTILFSAHELNPLLGVMDQVLYLGAGHGALGSVEAVIDSAVLSRLYGAPVEVIRAQGRIFVLAEPRISDARAAVPRKEAAHVRL